MSDDKICRGDVVLLKSAPEGPRMTVVRTDIAVGDPAEWVRCNWFVEGHLHVGDFPIHALRKIAS